jgi:hypothetical protein
VGLYVAKDEPCARDDGKHGGEGAAEGHG